MRSVQHVHLFFLPGSTAGLTSWSWGLSSWSVIWPQRLCTPKHHNQRIVGVREMTPLHSPGIVSVSSLSFLASETLGFEHKSLHCETQMSSQLLATFSVSSSSSSFHSRRFSQHPWGRNIDGKIARLGISILAMNHLHSSLFWIWAD